MKATITSVFIPLFIILHDVNAQKVTIDKAKFFEDTSIVSATITTNMVKLYRQKDRPGLRFPANLSFVLPDGTPINDTIALETRGHFRKVNCSMPPLKIIFNYDSTAFTEPLGDLKLVNRCKNSASNEQYVLREFLIYKIYNLITDMSFRVRLLNIKFIDNTGKKKPLSEYGFLMEPTKSLAKRNDCKYLEDVKIDPRDANRLQMTTVDIFEYMIGNTDWGVGSDHNTKLLISKIDSTQRPFVVPYDFDFSGLVNSDYAVPDPMFQTTSVRERVYRGFPKTIEEINSVLDIFKKQKDSIYQLINHFDLLSPKSKKEMTGYLDEFYEIINKPNDVKKVFIDNARTQ